MKLRKAATIVASILALLAGFVAPSVSHAEETAPPDAGREPFERIWNGLRSVRPQRAQSESERTARDALKALGKHDYDRAGELLKKAIASNPGDAGIAYDPLWPMEIDANEMDHGREQVEKMLADRPQMKLFINSGDDLYWWVVRKFSARLRGNQILWDPELPEGADAQHHPPTAARPGFIQVHKISPHTGKEAEEFEQLWSCAVFELHNMDSERQFKQLYVQAMDNRVTENQFVRAMFEIETAASQRMRVWYADVYLPHAKKYRLATSPYQWYCTEWDSSDKQFVAYSDKASYPWTPYCSYYQGLQARNTSLQRASVKPKSKSFVEAVRDWFARFEKEPN